MVLFLLRNAILKISAVFAVVRCPSVHPSVYPSVMLVDCIHTAEGIVKLLVRPGSPITVVFFTLSADTQFQGEPLQRGRKIHGGGKFCDFRLKSSFISETVPNRLMVAM